MKLSHDDMREAWKKAGLFDLSWPDMKAFCHGRSGRLFYGSDYLVWFEEMEDRYGSED